MTAGWDSEYGGLYYFMDIDGRPTLQLESNMKLWWPHTEAIYALVLAYSKTRYSTWLDWLKRVDEYADAHFVDKEYGGMVRILRPPRRPDSQLQRRQL